MTNLWRVFLAALLCVPTVTTAQTVATTDVVFHTPIPLLHLEPGSPVRQWIGIDLKAIDPRFADVLSVDVQGDMMIQGPGVPGYGCQQWLELRSNIYPGGGSYHWQMISESTVTTLSADPIPYEGSITVPTIQQPRKRVALANGVFYVMWAYATECPSAINLSLVSALVPFSVGADPSFAAYPTSEVVATFQGPFWVTDTANPAYHAPDTWHTFDLTALDPRFATVDSVVLEGILILSPSTTAGVIGHLCDMRVEARRPGGPTQIVYSTVTRSDYGSRWTVPNLQQPARSVGLLNGAFEVRWTFTPGCVGGINLTIPSVRLP